MKKNYNLLIFLPFCIFFLAGCSAYPKFNYATSINLTCGKFNSQDNSNNLIFDINKEILGFDKANEKCLVQATANKNDLLLTSVNFSAINLPNGLYVNSNGQILGTPTTIGKTISTIYASSSYNNKIINGKLDLTIEIVKQTIYGIKLNIPNEIANKTFSKNSSYSFNLNCSSLPLNVEQLPASTYKYFLQPGTEDNAPNFDWSNLPLLKATFGDVSIEYRFTLFAENDNGFNDSKNFVWNIN